MSINQKEKFEFDLTLLSENVKHMVSAEAQDEKKQIVICERHKSDGEYYEMYQPSETDPDGTYRVFKCKTCGVMYDMSVYDRN